jgi:RND family efflux transporter MFP subunit
MHILAGILAFFGLGAPPTAHPVLPPPAYVVQRQTVTDEKPIFATVEPVNLVPARARISGTVLELKVHPGDHVGRGSVIAIVADPKLTSQTDLYVAQVRASQTKLAEAKAEFDRAQHLVKSGVISQSEYDQDQANYNVALSNVKAAAAQSAVIKEQVDEGKVLAPVAGRVVTVPVTAGTVVMGGESIATVAQENFVIRLEIPEEQAQTLKVGNRVRLDDADFDPHAAHSGTISLIYPQVENGDVAADAVVSGIGDYFVGRRVRVWIPVGRRSVILIPENMIVTRSGIDYARLWTREVGGLDVPVQRGEARFLPSRPPELEILSGLQAGDRLLKP